jgi:hypothetical protein
MPPAPGVEPDPDPESCMLCMHHMQEGTQIELVQNENQKAERNLFVLINYFISQINSR